ncbi:hypothetical protein [Legionella drozanskii]|uniref:Uncharacterized protein n=1 Tax=Legionella drozanskii LLAP-1 TaxID=1212489 RepID=A0A0W0SWF9_9GAMM|nr:hypothetical protein [Legionella drozanskii]KTC87636.1 hypothetical protein Ldro_1255 [Legionella drozanskii LLAP-1]
MRYTNVSDKEYKGFDITIYEMKQGDYILDVKKPCGELIAGWEHKKTFNCAMMTGVNYIDEMVARGVEA